MSVATARRIALGAQGFGRARPEGRVDRRHVRRMFDTVGVVQIDSVNVIVRSQELPLWARLGAHEHVLQLDEHLRRDRVAALGPGEGDDADAVVALVADRGGIGHAASLARRRG